MTQGKQISKPVTAYNSDDLRYETLSGRVLHPSYLVSDKRMLRR